MKTEKTIALLDLIDDILAFVGLAKMDKYDRIADELTNVLLHKWNSATKAAINDMIRELRRLSGKAKPAAIDAQLELLAVRLGPKFANQVSAPLFEAHVEAFTKGQTDIRASFGAKFNLVDEKAIAALHEHNIYWVREQYDKNLGESIRDIGTQVLREGMSYRQAGELFEAELGEKYQAYGTKYWRGVATNVTTRSREIGRVNAYEKAGIRYLEVRAILDHRTSKICRRMHGRIIAVKKAIDMRDELIAAESPEDVKKIAPWRKEDFVRGKKTSSLPHGMSLPPYHFRCRTRTVAADMSANAETAFGDQLSGADKKILDALTPAEHYARTQGLQGARWNDKDFTHDVKNHAGEFGLDGGNKEDRRLYRVMANKTIVSADRVLAKVHDGEMQYLFFSAAEKAIAVVDMSGRVRGLYGHAKKGGLDVAFEKIQQRAAWIKNKN